MCPPRLLALLTLPLLLTAAACRSPTKEAADREVYGILEARRCRVPQVAGTLQIEAADRIARAAREGRRHQLDLRDALALASAASREYRREREDVYLTALALTGARNDYRPIFGIGGSIGVSGDETGGTFDAGADVSVSRAFETGGSVVVALASDFLKGLATGDPFDLARTLLSLDIVIPLGRGAGWVARENLTQAERDALYALRDFARFQQEFTVDVAARFYRVLQARDTWKNEEMTYESLVDLLARQEALGAGGAGRLPDFQVDQARQDLLLADDRRQRARASYETQLDLFKLDLGVAIDAEIELDDADLDALRGREPPGPPRPLAESMRLAPERRLDLQNAREQEEDAFRRALVARNALGPQLDLRLGGALTGPDRRPFDLENADASGRVGLDVDLPLDRTDERNAYRTALVQAARARREREGRIDDVLRTVREAYRDLAEAEMSYRIQLEGVRLALRRVESTTLLLEAGQATTRDRLEAEQALVGSRNSLTGALVDHAVALLQIESRVGTLTVDGHGVWRPGAVGIPVGPGTVGSPHSPGTVGSPGSPGAVGIPVGPGTVGSPGSPGTVGSPGGPAPTDAGTSAASTASFPPPPAGVSPSER